MGRGFIDVIIVAPDDVKEVLYDHQWFAYDRDEGDVLAAIDSKGELATYDGWEDNFYVDKDGKLCAKGIDGKVHYFSGLAQSSKIDIASRTQGIKFKI